MNIINLHHGADDNNHMAMQGVLQLGVHAGGYYDIETVGWPANRQIHAFHWLFGKFMTVVSVNNAKDMHCSTQTISFHRSPSWQRAWQSDASARR